MKTFLLLLTFFAFLQSAFLPVNMVLVILIARSLVAGDRGNLILAFLGGLILSFLSQVNLGYYPLVFILVVKSGEILKRLPVSFNPLVIFCCGSVLITSVSLLNSVFISIPVELYPHLFEAVLVLPAYFFIKIWEERFLAKPYIKLKV